jgi:hypothetical protein
MKIGGEIVIGKDDAAGASAVRKPPEDRRGFEISIGSNDVLCYTRSKSQPLY